MVDEEALLPLSMIAQYGFCPRRAGLILLEQSWADNAHTAEGTDQHERVHQAGSETRKTEVGLHSVAVRSLELGLSGSVDCIELSADPFGFAVKGRAGLWKLRPVEYKHGEVRNEWEYEMQLCAQAMCLEEMLGCRIEEGDLFFYNDHRRFTVSFSNELRMEVTCVARKLHDLVRSGKLPAAEKSRKCRECSMKDICMPEIRDRSAAHLKKLATYATGGEDDE